MQIHKCGLDIIKLENVGVSRFGHDIIKDVNLTLKCGGITAIIGVNGAGKTTLIRTLLGDIKYKGKISFTDHNGKASRDIKIGYVPQQLSFDKSTPTSVMDLLCAAKSKYPAFLGYRRKDKLAAMDLLNASGCAELAKRRIGELSGGELQRIMLAMALDPVPDLLILDEPVSSLDINAVQEFYTRVFDLRQSYHMAIIIVTHDFKLVSDYADKVVMVDGGRADIGSPQEILTSDAFKRVFGAAYFTGGVGH